MPSGQGKKRAFFFGWLSLKGSLPQKKGKKRAPLGNWGRVGQFSVRVGLEPQYGSDTARTSSGPVAVSSTRSSPGGEGGQELQPPPRRAMRECFSNLSMVSFQFLPPEAFPEHWQGKETPTSHHSL